MATQVTVITGEGSTSYSVSTGARGPAGPEGTITNSSVNTAIATNPSATRTAAGLVIGTDVAAQGDTRIEPQVKSSSFTASNGETYHVVGSATVTDPSPVEGKGFSVLVRNGTATVGGTAYGTAGTIIERTFHSGGWSNYSYQQASAFDPAGSAASAAAASVSNEVQFLERFLRLPNATITSSSVANPTVITTSTAHRLTTGDMVGIAGHTGSTPSILGQHTVTVISPTTFSIPVNVTVGGTGGVVGKAVKENESPQVGSSWKISRNASGSAFGVEYPHNTPYGLRAARETLLYMGATHTEPVTSMTFVVHWRQSATPLAAPINGITIATSASTLIPSLDTIALPPRMLHMTLSRNQPPSVGLGTGAGGAVWSDPATSRVSYTTSAFDVGMPYNVDSLVRIELEEGEMRVFVPGAIYTYNDARFNSELIGANWWMEIAGDRFGGVDYKEVPYIKRVWLNTPLLDALPGQGSQAASGVLERLSQAGTVQLPQKIQVLGDSVFALGLPTAGIASPLAIFSENGKFIGRPNVSGGGAIYAVPFMTGWINDPYTSLASATDAAAFIFQQVVLAQIGEREVTVVHGFFANNANSKRVKVDSTGLAAFFDTGAVTTANQEWRLEISRAKQTAATTTIKCVFISPSGVMTSYVSGNFGGAAGLSVKVSGVAAGDVIIRDAYMTTYLKP